MPFDGEKSFIIDQNYIIWDAESPAIMKTFGFRSEAEIVGHYCHKLFFNSDIPCMNCPVPRALKNKMLSESVIEEPSAPTSNKTRNAKAILIPVSDGKSQRILVDCLGDISFRKKKKMASLNLEDPMGLNFFKADTFDNIPFKVYVIDYKFKILTFNDRVLEDASRTREEIVGSNLFKAFPQFDDKSFKKAIRLYLKSDTSEPKRIRIDGDETALASEHVVRMFSNDDGIKSLMIMTLEEGTPRESLLRRRFEEQLRAIGKVVGKMAHDINNPLMIITNHLDMMRRDVEESSHDWPGFQKDAEEIERQANKIAEYLARVRFMQPFSHHDITTANIKDILETSIAVARFQLPQKDVDIRLEAPEESPEIKCCETYLQEAFVHLIKNAGEAVGKKGQVTITLEHPAENNHVIIKFKDNGPGIPAKMIPQVFETFYTTKKASKGHGLGLPIAFSAVMYHRGQLHVNSEIDRGTEIVVKLPIEFET